MFPSEVDWWIYWPCTMAPLSPTYLVPKNLTQIGLIILLIFSLQLIFMIHIFFIKQLKFSLYPKISNRSIQNLFSIGKWICMDSRKLHFAFISLYYKL